MVNSFYIYFEIFALLSCIYSYKKFDENFKVFLPFLIFVVVYELANYFNLLIWHKTNAWCNNLEGIVELVVLGRFISSLNNSKSFRKKVDIAIVIGVVFTLVDIFFIQGFWKLSTIAIVMQGSMLTVLICVYYYNLINTTNEHLNLLAYPPFYATVGILFYSLTEFFHYATFSYMLYLKAYHYYYVSRAFSNIACWLLYSLLSVSFLCFLKTKNRSL